MRASCLAPVCLFMAVSTAADAQMRDCTTLDGLLPDLMEGWSLFNNTPPNITETLITARYSLDLEVDADGNVLNPEDAETVSIRIDATPEMVAPQAALFQRGPMPGMMEAGPLGYPIMLGTYATVAGSFLISVDGNGPGTEMYYRDILSCAQAAGLAPAADYTE